MLDIIESLPPLINSFLCFRLGMFVGAVLLVVALVSLPKESSKDE